MILNGTLLEYPDEEMPDEAQVIDPMYPIKGDGTENLVAVESLEDILDLADGYIEWLRSRDRQVDDDSLIQIFKLMGVNPSWFYDRRTIDLIQTYLFYRPQPFLAYGNRMQEQPAIWVDAKLILDGIFEKQERLRRCPLM